MALWNGSSANDLIDWSTRPLDGTGDTGHSMNGFGGDDQIIGSNTLSNIIDGGTGNDKSPVAMLPTSCSAAMAMTR